MILTQINIFYGASVLTIFISLNGFSSFASLSVFDWLKEGGLSGTNTSESSGIEYFDTNSI